MLRVRQMRMRKYRRERRDATTHPESIRTVHWLTTHYPKRFMLSISVVAELSFVPPLSPLVPATGNIPRTRPDKPNPPGGHLLVGNLYLCVIFILFDIVYLSSIGYSILSSPLFLPFPPKYSPQHLDLEHDTFQRNYLYSSPACRTEEK
jgi:hypothetical protein